MSRKGKITGKPRGLVVAGNRSDGYRVWDDLGGHGPIVAGPFETHAEAWRWIDQQRRTDRTAVVRVHGGGE
jgi:hypothetical protein